MGYLHRLQRWLSTRYLPLFVFSRALSGCSKEKMDEMVAVAKEQSQIFVESPVIASVLPATEGNMLIQMAVQSDVDPSWVRTKLGIHEIPGKESVASSERQRMSWNLPKGGAWSCKISSGFFTTIERENELPLG
jgi:hypothetical protein